MYVGRDPATGRVDYWHVVHLLNGWQLAALVEPGLRTVPLARADGTDFGTWLAAELGVQWGPELAWGHLPLLTLPGLARDAYGRPVLAPTEHAAALEALGKLLLRFHKTDDS